MSNETLCDEEIEALGKLNERVYFKSHYNFLSEHKGWRPGEIHTFLGTAGGGKSTLIRSLILDLLENSDIKILLFLSEEDRLEFLGQFYKSGYKNQEALKRLHIISELDLIEKKESTSEIWQYIKFYMRENNIGFFIYDNITTSKFYNDLTIALQNKFAAELKKTCRELQIPFAIVVHAGALVSDSINRLIEMNDIRGNKTIVNVSHYFYIMQRFHTSTGIFPTLRITKHRSQDVEKRLYTFKYNKRARLYAMDLPIPFQEFKDAFKDREVLK